nr:Fic family protein [Neorhizobium tomejilense]
MAQRVLFTDGEDRSADRLMQRSAAEGKLIRVHEGIYVEPGITPVELVIAGRWPEVVAKIAPGAVLAGRSALRSNVWREPAVAGEHSVGWIFATLADISSPKRLSLPGLEVRIVPGPGPLPGDLPYLGVYLPSPARKLLDNLKPSRSREGPSRTAGREAVEIEVERLLRTEHEEGLAQIRRQAADLAPLLEAEAELAVLNEIIGVVLGTREAALSSRDVAARRRRVSPYDPDCMDRLRILAETMAQAPLPTRLDPHTEKETRANTSFIEAYFTNYIEGTRFLVDKAKRIIFQGDEPDGRPADGRDVTQTFSQVVHLTANMSMATTFEAFADEIRERNHLLLDARPEKVPGQFKTDPNRAGNTVFVMPEFVVGTLREGFAMMQGIDNPFAKALFAHTMLVLVHPFNDGNGRVSRIMMNKTLVSAGQCRIVVPTIFRTDYIGGLRAFTAADAARPAPLIRAMMRCQDVTSKISDPSLERTVDIWASSHAFLENEKDAQFTPPNPDAIIEWRNGVPAPEEYWSNLDMETSLANAQDNATKRMGF